METKKAETRIISDEKDRKYFKSYDGGAFPFTSNMIEEVYVSLETAKLAKEKGFNELLYTLYKNGEFKINKSHTLSHFDKKISNNGMADNCFSAPTQSFLSRWLRIRYNICLEVYCISCGFIWNICKSDGTGIKSSEHSGPNDGGAWDTYEDAKETGLQSALALLNVSQNYDNTIYIGKLGV